MKRTLVVALLLGVFSSIGLVGCGGDEGKPAADTSKPAAAPDAAKPDAAK
jgi:hypothetical protein